MMDVKVAAQFARRLALGFISMAAAASALAQNPSSATNPFYGSVTVQTMSDEPL
jgi:hypothetical protein